MFSTPGKIPSRKHTAFPGLQLHRSLGQGGWGGAEPGTSAEPRGQGCGWWQARSVEAYGPPLPMVGAQSHIQLLTQCIIITTNSPLKEIIIKMILADSRGNEERKVLIPYCPLMGTEDGQWAAARALTPQLKNCVKGGLPQAYYRQMLQPVPQPHIQNSHIRNSKVFRKP